MVTYKPWIDKAKDDLNWTKHNIESEVYYGACFSAQQAAEKALKSFLIFHQKRLRKIHDLRALIEDCILIDQEFNQIKESAIKLISYYSESRYPDFDIFSKFTEIQAKEAFESAEKIVVFIEKKLIEKQ
ncbi:MAG: HEPN domain protein [Candidatus Roizmanbacteria bacterium GW2011_GWA2_35_19]|uniref:HEPN domain protein n=2 Tax=Candidatus Roizmaniibacteriota TaxID=1752723 RepID=A0A0G0E5K9_9BACT|nr:MAG: HEPN domain protein [Candidatus Roizmanbacteria bacterium GW2011_GWC2_35_12]KKP70620.1 MAG: HEPN domain protein [Candidatus Roizmanbacteria bacterium GW2011_GWA2_35_19]